jgi:hypothetical protein
MQQAFVDVTFDNSAFRNRRDFITAVSVTIAMQITRAE